MLLRVGIWGCDHRCSWCSASCMVSYVEARILAFVFKFGNSGDLNLGSFGRGGHRVSSGGMPTATSRFVVLPCMIDQ